MRIAALAFWLLAQEAEGVYTDEERGFSMPIPKGWSVTRSADRAKALTMRPPAEAHPQSTCVVAVQDAMKAVTDGQVTLDRFLEEVKKEYPKKFVDFEFVKAEKGKDGENLTLSLVYKYTSGGQQKIQQFQHLVWTKTAHVSVVFGCRVDAFDGQLDFFEKHAKAFKALPKKP